MPGCIVSATTASFRSVEKRRRRATPVITSTFENVSDIGVCLGLYLGPPAKAGVRSKRGAVQALTLAHDPRLAPPVAGANLPPALYGLNEYGACSVADLSDGFAITQVLPGCGLTGIKTE